MIRQTSIGLSALNFRPKPLASRCSSPMFREIQSWPENTPQCIGCRPFSDNDHITSPYSFQLFPLHFPRSLFFDRKTHFNVGVCKEVRSSTAFSFLLAGSILIYSLGKRLSRVDVKCNINDCVLRVEVLHGRRILCLHMLFLSATFLFRSSVKQLGIFFSYCDVLGVRQNATGHFGFPLFSLDSFALFWAGRFWERLIINISIFLGDSNRVWRQQTSPET